jgi:deoxyribonuclease V
MRPPRTLAEARKLQEELRDQVVREDRLEEVSLVAGIDVHHDPRTGVSRAAVVVLRIQDLSFEAWAAASRRTETPYVPGFLSLREAPVALEALAQLTSPPDLLLVDGHGLAHPRRFGLACHLGVTADIPTIGVAKSRFVGEYEEPGAERGLWSPLVDRGEIVGAALRTRGGVKPVFVSTGHRVSLETALTHVTHCAPRYRLPEPIRLADQLSYKGEWS